MNFALRIPDYYKEEGAKEGSVDKIFDFLSKVLDVEDEDFDKL